MPYLRSSALICGVKGEWSEYGRGGFAEPGLDKITIELPDSVSVIADKGYDNDTLRERLTEVGFVADRTNQRLAA
jgi:hypothetical protein